MSLFDLILRKVARPVAFAMRKGVNMHPSLQQYIAQIAKKNQKEEKEVIEKAAQFLVFYTMAGSALVYYQMRLSPYGQMKERVRKHVQEWNELQQELDELYEKLPPPKLVRVREKEE